MSLSKKIRFEVFKRDGFQCSYCGESPPSATLEVDHINPVSKGGTDDINNLTTSCFNCNRGKSNIELNKITNRMSENLEILKQKEEQLKEYNKFIKKIDNRINKEVDLIEKIFKKTYKDKFFSERFKKSIKYFLKNMIFSEVQESMELACTYKDDDPEDATKYFCGICWNKIKNK